MIPWIGCSGKDTFRDRKADECYQGAEEAGYKGHRELSGTREMISILIAVVTTCLHVLPKLPEPNTEKGEFHCVSYHSVNRTPKTRAVQIHVKNIDFDKKQDSKALPLA